MGQQEVPMQADRHAHRPPQRAGSGAFTTRCDWLFDSEGARCKEAAVWESPCLMEDGSYKVWKLCEQHKMEAAESTRKFREELGARDTWRRVRQNDELSDSAEETK